MYAQLRCQGGPWDGNDTYIVDSTWDQLLENPGEGTDTVYASAHFGLFDNVENLVLVEGAGAINGTGTAGDNTISGNSDANIIDGGAGNDMLSGNGGADIMIGGAGDDVLTGGLGDDVFAFAPGYFGHDTIADFSAGDQIVFDHTLFASFADVQAHMMQVGNDVAITFDADDVLTLQNVSVAQLSQHDFLLA